MSDCKDKKCKDCNEDYLQGMLPCVTLPELCVDGETCEETYNANCVRYTGAAVVCGTTTVLSTGMTTQEALISLANAICLSGGGGLIDLTPLEQCCATNTTNITNLQTNLSIVNNTLTTISTQITTINTTLGTIDTQLTALQECCDASVKMCEFAEFPVAYALVGCTPDDKVTGQDLFYIDRQHAGLTENQITPANILPNWSGTLALDPVETASAFYVRAFSDTFGVSWRHNPTAPLVPDPLVTYYPVVQAGSFQIPYQNHYSTILNVDAYIGLSGIAGYTLLNDGHISTSGPGAPIEAIGIQGIASTSDIENIGGEFISKWRGATSGKNTAIRGKASGSDLNSGYDIEVGLITDTNRVNVGGKIVVKSGAGGTNHGLKIDVSQALGVTYAIQLKDTTAAAGKFLKAIDSDGNAIWDTVSGGSVPPGVVSNNNINGTPNYITKWTAADKIGDSLIQDDGTSLGIGVTPDAGALLQIYTSTMMGLSVISTDAGSNSAMYVSKGGTGFSKIGITTYANGATSINVGIDSSATTTNGTIGIGGRFQSTGAGGGQNGTNYAVQLLDGTETLTGGKYLRDMGDGKGHWANINITEVTNGLSSTLLGAPNGIATLDNNSKLVMSQMPITVMDYKGTYDIVTNVPVLVDGTGNQGDVYVCTTAGTRTFGAGNTITVGVGDWLIYNGTKWEKTLGNNVGAGTVTSVGLTVGTTGSDINISNSPITTSGAIGLNIPTASATARGVLSISDWLLFNSKVSAVSGTNNYVAKFTPNGTTIGNSSIFDDGSTVSIGSPIYTDSKLSLIDTSKTHIIHVTNSKTSGANFAGTYKTNGVGSSSNVGLQAEASNASAENWGLSGSAIGSSVRNIGLKAYANGATNNYSAWLMDGTQTSNGGKFLKDTGNGLANWDYLPDSAQIMCSDMISAITADAGIPKSMWVAPCNGQFTDAFASLRVPQTGGATFTVIVKTGSVTVATLTFTNGAVQWTSTNPTITSTFAKGDAFYLYVTQVGDGSARSLLVTLNYLRT